jgi:hypothetical protein
MPKCLQTSIFKKGERILRIRFLLFFYSISLTRGLEWASLRLARCLLDPFLFDHLRQVKLERQHFATSPLKRHQRHTAILDHCICFASSWYKIESSCSREFTNLTKVYSEFTPSRSPCALEYPPEIWADFQIKAAMPAGPTGTSSRRTLL